MTTIRELLKGSLRLINVIGANEEPSSDDMEVAKDSLNGLISSMGTDYLNIHTITPHRFLLEPGKQTYKVGPAFDEAGNPTQADWVTERPMRIEQAKLILNPVIPGLDFQGTPTTGLNPLTVNFTSEYGGAFAPTGYLWHFGVTGATGSGSGPSYTYADPGTYTVSLTAYSAEGGEITLEKEDYITVGQSTPQPLLVLHLDGMPIVDSSVNATTFEPFVAPVVGFDQTNNICNGDNPKFGTGSLNIKYGEFAGSSNRVYISPTGGVPSITGDFSVKFWHNMAYENSGTFPRVGVWDDIDANSWKVSVRQLLNEVVVILDTTNTFTVNGTPGLGLGGVLPFATTGTWYFIAAERENDNLVLTVNGQIVAQGTCTGYLDGGQWVIAGPYQTNGFTNDYQYGAFTDYLDEVRVDTYAYYGATGFTPPTGPFPNN